MIPWPPQLAELDPDERLDLVQAKITERIKSFAPVALIDLLVALGYPMQMLEFRAHASVTPRPSLFEEIIFPPRYTDMDEDLRVLITVNLGLLSCRSPLPSYMRYLVERSDNPYVFIDLLNMLDRSLIHGRLTHDRPDRILSDWPSTQANLLRSANLNSAIGLQWLCEQVFPELGVIVRRVDNKREINTIGARLDGVSKLGECSFGNRARVGVHELELVLICEDSRYDERRPWVYVGKQRLRDCVFPHLDEVCVTLTVTFVLLDTGTQAHLSHTPLEAGLPSYLGYDLMLDLDGNVEATREASPEASLEDDEFGDSEEGEGEGRSLSRTDVDGPERTPARLQVYRGTLPRMEPSTQRIEALVFADLLTARGMEPNVEILEGTPASPRVAVGRSVTLRVRCRDEGAAYDYLVVIDWGARAWYRDDPARISVDFVDDPGEPLAPKPAVELGLHANLWALLRDEARERLSAGLCELIVGDRPVTRRLVQTLERLRDYESLGALRLGKPAEEWDADAWRELHRSEPAKSLLFSRPQLPGRQPSQDA